jgi:solute:Na+ symporter, SSS family
MLGFPPLDLIVIATYVAAVIAVGVWPRLKIRNQEQYFLGGRRFGKFIQSFATFGHAATADGPVGVATTTFHNGIAGVWSSLLMVFSTPLFWFAGVWLRRMRIMTLGDFFHERYGSKRMAAAYAIVATVGMMNVLSAGYVATAMTISAMAPKPADSWTPAERKEHALAGELVLLERTDTSSTSHAGRARLDELRHLSPSSEISWISPRSVIWASCVLAILNAVMGGLTAAFVTSVLQGCCVLALSIVLIPFGVARINALYGGRGTGAAFHVMHAHLPLDFFRIYGSATLPDFTWYYVLTISVVAGLTVILQPNQLVTCAAARDESASRIGIVTGSFIKRVCTILWGIIGLFAALLYTKTLQNSDLVWGHATYDLLGPANCGLMGLMLVGILSALIAVSNSLMLTISGLITSNLYRPLRPGLDEVHYIAVGRVAGVLFLVGSALIATQFDNLLDNLKLNWEFFTVFSAAFWLGLKWRRANRKAAWASILVSAAVFYLVPLLLPKVCSSLRSNPTLALETYPREVTAGRVNNAGNDVQGPVVIPARSIFWSQGLAWDNLGHRVGRGYPYLDLLLLHVCGFDLRPNPYAFNETIRVAIRLFLPFAILMLIACLTPREDSDLIDRFFIKMRTRVTASGGVEESEGLADSLRDPAHPLEAKVFPNSDWEIYRWSRYDTVGFGLAVGLVFVILGMLWIVASY